MRMSEGGVEGIGGEADIGEPLDSTGQPGSDVCIRGVDEEDWPKLGYFLNERFEPPERA